MHFSMALDGPRYPPLGGARAKHIVLLLHGYGADGEDLIGLAPSWAAGLPGTLFMSPHAPFPCEGAPFGRQWFGIADRDEGMRLAGLRAAADMIDGLMDSLLAEHDLPPSSLALVGFSQGTMLALHVGPRREGALAGILGFSGRLLAPGLLAGEARTRPPVRLIHGDRDDLVPPDSMEAAAAALRGTGFGVETFLRPGLGHGIDPEGMRLGQEFLRAALSASAP